MAQFVRHHRLIVELPRADLRWIAARIPVPAFEDVYDCLSGELKIGDSFIQSAAGGRPECQGRAAEHVVRLAARRTGYRIGDYDGRQTRIRDLHEIKAGRPGPSLIQRGNRVVDAGMLVRRERAIRIGHVYAQGNRGTDVRRPADGLQVRRSAGDDSRNFLGEATRLTKKRNDGEIAIAADMQVIQVAQDRGQPLQIAAHVEGPRGKNGVDHRAVGISRSAGILEDSGPLCVAAQDRNGPNGGEDALDVAHRDSGAAGHVADLTAGDDGAAAVYVAAESEVAQDAGA